MNRHLSKVTLIVEKAGGKLWGRVRVNGNLITDSASTLALLKRRIQIAVQRFEGVDITGFNVLYDLTSFFTTHPVNASHVAARAGISPGLMRQYAAGIKFPSAARLAQIEKAIRQIGKELAQVRLVSEHARVA